MISCIIFEGRTKKNCKKNIFIVKIPKIYFLPITNIYNSSKISTFGNFGHLMQSKIVTYVHQQNLDF